MKTDKFTLFVYSNFLVLLGTYVCSQNINKQIVNIEDETLTDYSFLIRYHYTKSKDDIDIRIPMFIGTPCRSNCTHADGLIQTFYIKKYIRRLIKGCHYESDMHNGNYAITIFEM